MSNSVLPSPVFRKAAEFCVFTWYPATLLQWLVSSRRWILGGGGWFWVSSADSSFLPFLVSSRELVLGGGGPCLVPDISGTVSGFSPLGVTSAIETLYHLEEIPLRSVPAPLGFFFTSGRGTLSGAFSPSVDVRFLSLLTGGLW